MYGLSNRCYAVVKRVDKTAGPRWKSLMTAFISSFPLLDIQVIGPFLDGYHKGNLLLFFFPSFEYLCETGLLA